MLKGREIHYKELEEIDKLEDKDLSELAKLKEKAGEKESPTMSMKNLLKKEIKNLNRLLTDLWNENPKRMDEISRLSNIHASKTRSLHNLIYKR